MRPFDPYIDPQDGTRWLDPTSAHRISRIAQSTWRDWATRGYTSFTLPLKTARIPLTRGTDNKPRAPERQFRIVIAEQSVKTVIQVIQEVCGDNRRPRIRGFTKDELADLRDAVDRRVSRKRLQLGPTLT